MTCYTGRYDKTHTVNAAPDVVLAQFLDLDQIIAQYGDLDSADKPRDGVIRFTLSEQNHGVFTFAGRYACHYEADGDDAVVWHSVDKVDGDNVETEGRLTVAPGDAPGTTKLHYAAEMTLDIDVKPMLAPVLKPVVEGAIPSQMGAYVKRMCKAVEDR